MTTQEDRDDNLSMFSLSNNSPETKSKKEPAKRKKLDNLRSFEMEEFKTKYSNRKDNIFKQTKLFGRKKSNTGGMVSKQEILSPVEV